MLNKLRGLVEVLTSRKEVRALERALNIVRGLLAIASFLMARLGMALTSPSLMLPDLKGLLSGFLALNWPLIGRLAAEVAIGGFLGLACAYIIKSTWKVLMLSILAMGGLLGLAYYYGIIMVNWDTLLSLLPMASYESLLRWAPCLSGFLASLALGLKKIKGGEVWIAWRL